MENYNIKFDNMLNIIEEVKNIVDNYFRQDVLIRDINLKRINWEKQFKDFKKQIEDLQKPINNRKNLLIECLNRAKCNQILMDHPDNLKYINYLEDQLVEIMEKQVFLNVMLNLQNFIQDILENLNIFEPIKINRQLQQNHDEKDNENNMKKTMKNNMKKTMKNNMKKTMKNNMKKTMKNNMKKTMKNNMKKTMRIRI
ncbi:MAG: hypothetical protein ACTSRZ_21505 [Promethearchaeota archaeon]